MDMNPYDAAVLFWYVRNRLFYELNLENYDSIMMLKYDDLILKPSKTMKQIYDFLGYDFPGKQIVNHVHSNSLGKGKKIVLSEDIEKLAEKLWNKLNDSYQIKNYFTVD
ncbi:MAG: sulfotransferase domain-containing protein [Candidatus Helarchaeota archaeon]